MNATKTLRLRPLPNGRRPNGYSLRDDDQGHRIGIIYERAHAVRVVKAVNLFDEMVERLKRLADASATVGNLDHAGAQVPPDAWAELWATNCAARALLAKVKRE